MNPDDQELRLRCLGLAVQASGYDPATLARTFYEFVTAQSDLSTAEGALKALDPLSFEGTLATVSPALQRRERDPAGSATDAD